MLQRFYFLSVSVLVDIVYSTYLPNLNTVDFNKPKTKTNLELSSVKLVSWLAVFFTFHLNPSNSWGIYNFPLFLQTCQTPFL